MRFDKLTTKFQQALADAQSIAVGQDHAYIEPAHLLLALLQQEDGVTVSLLQRCGTNVVPLRDALKNSLDRKSTRLNSSHVKSSYAVFCLKKKRVDTLR